MERLLDLAGYLEANETPHENRIYSLKIHCGDDYPNLPPQISFLSKVNLTCVNQTNGQVNPQGLACLANWKRSFTLETILSELRK